MCTLFNLGCKLNQYEGYCLKRKLSGNSQIVIVNTCCVTHRAAQKSRKKFHHALKQYPNHQVIATGCACTLFPDDYAQAHRIIDTTKRNQLIAEVYPETPRSRYFMKIQDGCTEPCTYCIVSVVRNQISSKPVGRIIEEIAWARSRGFEEVVLVGANIGLYGGDIDKSLPQLLHELTKVHDLPRLRLSSIEPRFITDALITAMRDLSLCRHVHLPVQSADNSILRRMGRTYTNQELRAKVVALTRAFSDLAIGVDVIVGFPGETEECFDTTRSFIEDMPVTHVHVFPYSPRPGTAVYEHGDPVALQVKKERLWQLKHLVAEKNLRFRKRLVGKDLDAIVVKTAPACIGLTDNYVPVELDRTLRPGTRARVRVMTAGTKGTTGIVNPTDSVS